MTQTVNEAVRVPNVERYSVHIGEESVHLCCKDCKERNATTEGWFYMFQSTNLGRILDAILRHENNVH